MINLALNPNFISLFGIEIKWYAVFILSGVFLATFLSSKEAKKKNLPKDYISDLLFYILPIGIIGARIYYVIFEWQQYINNPIKIFYIWEGGIAIYGGLIAGVLTIYFYNKKHNIPFWITLDIIAPTVLLAQAIGRWGNFMNQEAHGSPTTLKFLQNLHLPQFIIEQMNINGIYYQPTFLYESIASFIGFIIIFLLRHKLKKLKVRDISAMYLFWYGTERFIIEGMRTDSLWLGDFRVSQLLSLVLIMSSVILFLYNRKNRTLYHEYIYRGE